MQKEKDAKATPYLNYCICSISRTKYISFAKYRNKFDTLRNKLMCFHEEIDSFWDTVFDI